MSTAAPRPRVVIVGGGFGGLFAAKFLKRAAVDITLVERTNHHLFQPLLYQVATGILSPGAVAPPLREVLKKHDNVKVRLGEVTGFDLAARTVHVEHPSSSSDLPYDYLIFATGVGSSYFGHDEFAPHAPTMKTVDDALTLRTRIFGAFEMAALAANEEERRAWLTFAVVGGGPTGVEVAGQIAELAHRSLDRNFREFDPSTATVILFEGGDEILPTFGDRLSGKATHELTRLGVDVRAKTRVTDVTRDEIVIPRALPARSGSPAGRRSGRPAWPPARWPVRSPRRPARRWTERDGSRSSRTAPSPATPRSTSSGT